MKKKEAKAKPVVKNSDDEGQRNQDVYMGKSFKNPIKPVRIGEQTEISFHDDEDRVDTLEQDDSKARLNEDGEEEDLYHISSLSF